MNDLIKVCSLDELEVGGVAAFDVDGVEIAVVRIADEVFAIRDECSHMEIPLSEGDVDADGCQIECWLHGSRFDLRTGKPTGLPATEPVDIYPCRIEDGAVFVDVHNPYDVDDR